MELRSVKMNPIYVIIGGFIMLALTLGFSMNVSAHGYVDGPSSRAVLCQEGVNKDCGAVVYEPQSIEGPGDFPNAGVPDGQIASGGGVFPELDEQGEDRWAKVGMSSGAYTFSWTLTAAHATEKWDYYITKEDWDPNSPLKRSDLELFCSIDDGGKRPDFQVEHDCVIPDRSGYHVILAYWEVADTANAFYQVIDANFDGDFVEPGEPEEPEEPEEPNAPAWDANSVYLSGDEVTYDGKVYRAQWWTQGDTPGESNVWALVGEGESGGDEGDGEDPAAPAWNASLVYTKGDLIIYDGKVYEALWWTQGETPGDASVWVLR
ncbi:lytic polysaccharide monooxygenase [Ornithinibacillus gellani]|uniref:lytic polysaccharide monooxygenase n=1 Tax=Ornithinibacillus gellani TaxID=2293253 RepID=UPI001CC20E0F|nr:lytic polysaccharide monooxygenase [Ornithinibacillus gellani]